MTRRGRPSRSDGVTMRVEGISETVAALGELPKSYQRQALTRALVDAGGLVAEAAEAANQTRTLRGRMRVQVRGAARKAPRGQGDRGTVWVLVGPAGSRASAVIEFGSRNNAPLAFMRPAWARSEGQVLDSIRDALAHQTREAAGRAARKAARAARRALRGG